MIDIDELRIKQVEFEAIRIESDKDIRQLETHRKAFVRKFSKDKLENLKVDDYVVGKGNESFCNLLENRLQGLGNIHGATSFKFGIYFGKTKSDPEIKYRFRNRFGSNGYEAFANVKNAVINLLELAENKDIEGIKKNTLYPIESTR